MDKFEYNLKLDQIKELLAVGKNEEAAEVADTINWNKVKNVNALVKAGEVYEKVERYKDSREILLNAYDRSPIGRTIIYRLAEVAIKMKDFEGAQEYYDEFVAIAPHDNQRYMLMYNMKKAQDASYTELISILEELKDQEYTEEWAFELAYLYHKAGMVDKCIESCDELVLWFGDGPYVERALELKMLYEPLTKAQEDKYRQFRHEREGKTVVRVAEKEREGEYIHEQMAIPQVTINPEKFNTTNLQEEIVKGMQQIIEATEKETVAGTMDNIKKIVEEVPYLQLPTEEELVAKKSAMHIATDEEIDGSLRISFQDLLGEDADGQLSMVVKDKTLVEHQITGQLTITEVLEEWEKTRRAVETALQEVEQKKLESAKALALQEAEDIMVRLNDVLPKIETAKTPEELFDNMNSMLDKEIERLNTENTEIDEQLKQLEKEIALFTQPTMRMPNIDLAAMESLSKKDADIKEEIVEEEPIVESVLIEIDTLEEIPQADVIIQVETDTTEEKDLSVHEYIEKEDIKSFEEDVVEDLGKEIKKNILREDIPPMYSLSEEQKAIFSYFVPVKGMEAQLCKALYGMIENLNGETSSARENLIIQGCQGCGKTVLATSIIKVLQIETGKLKGRIGKIEASALNKKDVRQLLKKVAGGCLIIERAGELDRTTTVTLSLLMEQEKSGTLVILEDTAAGIKRALATDDGFAKKFTEVVNVPIFSNNELIHFANSYANELGYVIDEMAILALHNRISNIERLDQATTLVEVKDIIDEAIEREANGGIRKAFNILTAKRYTDDDKIVLTEKDFQ